MRRKVITRIIETLFTAALAAFLLTACAFPSSPSPEETASEMSAEEKNETCYFESLLEKEDLQNMEDARIAMEEYVAWGGKETTMYYSSDTCSVVADKSKATFGQGTELNGNIKNLPGNYNAETNYTGKVIQLKYKPAKDDIGMGKVIVSWVDA